MRDRERRREILVACRVLASLKWTCTCIYTCTHIYIYLFIYFLTVNFVLPGGTAHRRFTEPSHLHFVQRERARENSWIFYETPVPRTAGEGDTTHVERPSVMFPRGNNLNDTAGRVPLSSLSPLPFPQPGCRRGKNSSAAFGSRKR